MASNAASVKDFGNTTSGSNDMTMSVDIITKRDNKDLITLAWDLMKEKTPDQLSPNTLRKLLSEEDATDDWSLEKIQNKVFQSAFFWMCVIDIIDADHNLTYKYNMKTCIENVHLYCNNISAFVRKIKNLQEKIQKKNKPELLESTIIEVKKIESLGEECKKKGITEHWLHNPEKITIDIVTRKLILELRVYKNRNQIKDKTFAVWVKYLCNLPTLPHLGRVWLSLDRMFQKKNKLKGKDREEYLAGEYHPPKHFDHKNLLKCKSCKTFGNEIETEKKTSKTETDLIGRSKCTISELRRGKFEAQFQLYKLNKENKTLTQKLTKCQQRLSFLSVRNVNKRLKRRNEKIRTLTEDNQKLKKQHEHLQRVTNRIRRKYKQRATLLKYYNKKVKQLKSENEKKRISENREHCSPEKTVQNENSFLKEQVNFLENENEEMKETIEELIKNQEIKTFENGKYNDTIREVYAALLSMNVGVNNVEQIVRTVLNKLCGVKIGRLPKKTFAEIMLIEAKALAQIQSIESIVNSGKTCTLHTDGTKRKGREYGGLQLGTSSGQFSLGITEIVQGNADSFFEMIKDIFNQLGKLSDKENSTKKSAEIICNIKNMMTDRHVVNNSLNDKLEMWKSECFPLIIDNFNEFSSEVKKSFVEINHFKCNLHVLVNLGSQAEAALKEWERAIIVSDDLLPELGTWSVSTPDFIRAATKLCVPGADQKSGYGLLFHSYLQSLDPPPALKMSTFYGHRINVLFSMAASVFYHSVHIKDFISQYFDKKQNNLVSSASHYINNNVYLAGCRALGIIDKLCTGPLWRQIENATHILDLNNMWLTFYNFLDEYSKDSSDLLDGKIIYPEYTKQDDIFECLFSVDDEELNVLTAEALQILCTNFLIIVNRQLFDYLPGGKFNVDTARDFESLKNISVNVCPTNMVSERDFANLDRLRREKPNANTIALEGMILFTNNKTLNWLENLEPDKKEQVFKLARENAPKMIKSYKEQKQRIQQKHVELLQKKKDEALKTQQNKIDEILKVTQEVEKYGGQWQSEDNIIQALHKLSNLQKVDAVKSQIKFQRLVLKKNPTDKTLFKFSFQGNSLTLEQLLENFRKLSNIQCEISKQNCDLNENAELPCLTIKSKEEREQFMAEKRAIIIQKLQDAKQKATEQNKNEKVPEQCLAENNEPKRKHFKKSPPETETNKQFSIYNFTLGDTVAVAYSDCWYPGQVEKIINNTLAKIKFLHPTNSKQTVFQWPKKEDIIDVDNIFVFDSGFELLPNDNNCRTWTLPNAQNISKKYNIYKKKYF